MEGGEAEEEEQVVKRHPSRLQSTQSHTARPQPVYKTTHKRDGDSVVQIAEQMTSSRQTQLRTDSNEHVAFCHWMSMETPNQPEHRSLDMLNGTHSTR